jgi:predicted porin
MNRKLIAAVVSGALVLPVAALAQDEEAMEVPEHSHPSVLEHEHELGEGEEMMMAPMHGHSYASHPAAAHEHDASHGHSSTVYGTLRYGVTMSDSDVAGSSSMWDIGSVHGSRFGIKGSTSAGAGLTAGFQLERALNDGLTARHHNVHVSGGFGTVTLGQHSSPYYGATTWDGSNHLGGLTDGGLRRQGVSYASALGGPFDFKVFLGDGSTDASTAAIHDDTDAHAVTAATGGDGSDHIEASGSFAAGPLSFTAGYRTEPDDSDRIGGTVKGSAANITLHVGYEAATDLPGAACANSLCDADRFGFNLSYLLGAGPGGGNVYVQYGERASDDAYAEKRDVDYWALGYSYYVSEAVTVNVVHRTQDGYNKVAKQRLTDRTSAVVLKVDF